jgi:hypothetical protein
VWRAKDVGATTGLSILTSRDSLITHVDTPFNNPSGG